MPNRFEQPPSVKGERGKEAIHLSREEYDLLRSTFGEDMESEDFHGLLKEKGI